MQPCHSSSAAQLPGLYPMNSSPKFRSLGLHRASITSGVRLKTYDIGVVMKRVIVKKEGSHKSNKKFQAPNSENACLFYMSVLSTSITTQSGLNDKDTY